MKSTVETKIIELVKSGHELAKELHCAESAALVRNLATQLEVQLVRSKALATENAALKSVVAENWNMRDVLRQLIAGRPGGVYFNKWEPLIFKALNATPATDAFLAEVRAQGVEMFADELLCPDLDGSIREFAAQIRKGVQS
ncbi:TPA: hypothetical protein LSH87_003755 [Citrobacter koseri]|uniref:hypothetical protein n=1 Tax=Citrobacter koseri TaxID=545 RepID=UPI0023B01062|nr:hypothetical protein [Citrobacter koseri]HBL6925846.1 hypothetical protein [Citrobacter koseri]HBL6930749.1 hypothetical protein [Citrobacter koseri]